MQTVKIEKLSNLGLGIAKLDGFVYFVEGACPGDIVNIDIVKKNKNFANAKIVSFVEKSKFRVEPKCKMQKVCGACQLQFIDYDAQLVFKKEIVQDTMKSIYGDFIEVNNVIKSPEIYEYRHKIQYPVSETKESKRIHAGYYKPNSHELVNIKYCPIQPNYCDEIIEFIRNTAKDCSVSGYNEKHHSGELRHVVIRTSTSKMSIIVLVVNADYISKGIKKLANEIYSQCKNILGVLVNFNNKKTNLILGEKTILLNGQEYVEQEICDRVFKIGAKTFFQVNPKSADNIFRYVKKHIVSNYNKPTILDAYAGITAFGICLSDTAEKVVSIEEVKESVDLAKVVVSENHLNNITLYNGDASKFFEEELKNGNKYDIIILDPPRKGCTKSSLDYAIKLCKNEIIYVSCNPATLARDLKYLKENGYTAQFIQPFDMFPHTYHIENVVFLKKG